MSTALVVTSIHPPNAALRELAAGCGENHWDFILAGDTKSPPDFHIDGCRFLSIESQAHSGLRLAEVCPERSYTRKNIGYLEAIRSGASVIVETDDDNHPRGAFWTPRSEEMSCRTVEADAWVNAYQYFCDKFIYPRGLPLAHARDQGPEPGPPAMVSSPIHQGLADEDPDVDAVYRMLFPLPFRFDRDRGPVLLQGNAWCPFNSQNTTFFRSAFPLLYLPAACSFRMTDIWRSFVAQRVLHHLGNGVLFHGPSVWQERNDHDLHRDFIDELPGYTHNSRIREVLMEISFDGIDSIPRMMECCYEEMMSRGWIGALEESLLKAWLEDLDVIGHS
jgi:hypothetical protein